VAGHAALVGSAAGLPSGQVQLVTGDGTAWLAVLQDGRWLIEARYD
jgi:hypothetical protein